MAIKVIDSYALVAYFRDEPGAEAVETILVSAARKHLPLHMTEIDYAETKFTILQKDGPAAWDSVREVLQGLPIQFHTISRDLSDTAADILVRYNISAPGAFAVALATPKKGELFSANPELKSLALAGIKLHWLG